MLKNYLSIEISPQELKERFQNYFDETMGIKPYIPCPCCNSELVPRESRFGRFIGCSAYPKCKFKASCKATRK
jgi:ssDNA-binding Zn-finger/Zn-ribbon topoisomerase 1